MFRGAQLAADATGRPVRLLMSGWAPNQAIRDAFADGASAFAPGVTVTFVDGMDPASRFDVWRAADLVVSLVDNIQETFGLVVVEAMKPISCSIGRPDENRPAAVGPGIPRAST